mmetsp:Transcript_21445/g.59399  ORF Transcript_21445/g.59399 Transcript_21445/m.59399 type:complete len:98 (-) Transcript_21445:1618-1911(-)
MYVPIFIQCHILKISAWPGPSASALITQKIHTSSALDRAAVCFAFPASFNPRRLLLAQPQLFKPRSQEGAHLLDIIKVRSLREHQQTVGLEPRVTLE